MIAVLRHAVSLIIQIPRLWLPMLTAHIAWYLLQLTRRPLFHVIVRVFTPRLQGGALGLLDQYNNTHTGWIYAFTIASSVLIQLVQIILLVSAISVTTDLGLDAEEGREIQLGRKIGELWPMRKRIFWFSVACYAGMTLVVFGVSFLSMRFGHESYLMSAHGLVELVLLLPAAWFLTPWLLPTESLEGKQDKKAIAEARRLAILCAFLYAGMIQLWPHITKAIDGAMPNLSDVTWQFISTLGALKGVIPYTLCFAGFGIIASKYRPDSTAQNGIEMAEPL